MPTSQQFKSLLWLLKRRHWTNLPEEDNFSDERLASVQEIESLAFTCHDALHDRKALVLPISDRKLNVKTVRALFDVDSEENQDVKVVVGLTNGTITTHARAHFEESKIALEELQWNFVSAASSILSKIQICGNGGEVLSRCKSLRLPRISSSDPVSKLLSLQGGDVINIYDGIHFTQRWL
jgi:hypothetical protein